MHLEYELCAASFLAIFLLITSIRQGTQFLSEPSTGGMTGMIVLAQWTELAAAGFFLPRIDNTTGREMLVFAVLAMQSAVPVFLTHLCVRRPVVETSQMLARRMVNILPYLICLMLLFWSIWTHYIFYVDAHGFHTGKYFWIVPLNYGLYVVSAVSAMLFRRKRRRMQFGAAVLIMAVGAVPGILICFLPDLPHFCLCTTIMVFLMYSSKEAVALNTDVVSGALNREALMADIKTAYHYPQRGHVYAIALDGFKHINETYGAEGGNGIMQQIVRDLQLEFSRNTVYRFGGDIFVVLSRPETENAKVLDSLRKIFSSPFRAGDAAIRVTACIGIVHLDTVALEEVTSALEYAVGQAKHRGKAAVFEMGASSTDVMKRRKAIEQALSDQIRRNTFEVHYQPIWDIQQQRFHSMEALARLNVPGFGYVSPEEFIRIAEKNGSILRIGLIVLEEVCRFIKETKLEEYGIDFVEVNLSVVQCTKDQIYNSVREILQRWDVPPQMINLEITESAAAYSEKKLIQNMARMALMDLTFSLDDYGSGYSNINYLVSLPFTIAKIDKYLVWAAAKSVMSREILQHTIAMFKAIHLRVVTEGIEDREMAQMVADMGADYIQGFYYSKPVPRDQVLARLGNAYIAQFQENGGKS